MSDGRDAEGTGRALDGVDRAILQALVDDARRSVRSIAREVHMSPGAVGERIARLESAGVISRYSAVLSQEVLGYRLAAVIGLQVQQGPILAGITERLLAIPEVEKVHLVSGQWDLFVSVRARDHDDLRRVILEEIWAVPGFRHTETMIVLDNYEKPATVLL